VWKKIAADVPSDLQVFANSKSLFTSGIIVKWLQFNFAFNTTPLLLLLDEFTGHNTDEVQEATKKLNMTFMVIPPGKRQFSKKTCVMLSHLFKFKFG